jgi:hypothetical protein
MRPPRCSGCGRAFVEILLDVGGREVTMRSCSACDVRSWHGPDGELALDGVLADLSADAQRR